MNETQPEQEIRDVIDTWMRATAFGDLDQVLDLMDEDVTFLLPGQPPMRGRDAFATAFRAMGASTRIEGSSDIREVEVVGDHAFVWNQLAVTVHPPDGGEVLKRAGSVLSVFRRGADGKWRLFRDANMLTQV